MIDQSFFSSKHNPLFPLAPSLSLSFSRLALLFNQTSQVSLLVLFLLIIIVFLISKKQKRNSKTLLLALFSTLLLWLLVTTMVRFYLSQKHFSKAQKLAQANSGQETVQQLKKAVHLNPLKDIYRLNLAQASLSLANEKSQKEKPDQKEIERLIQQAVEEGKIATFLNPKKTENWLGLGRIYFFLGDASGAKDWALKCYQKASELQPDSPRIHESIAALYYSQGKIEETKIELETTLSLTEPDSPDFQRIKKELEKLISQTTDTPEER